MYYKKYKKYKNNKTTYSKKNINKYKNNNYLLGGGIKSSIFKEIKNDFKNKMISDLIVLKSNTQFKTIEDIELFFNNFDISHNNLSYRDENNEYSNSNISASVSASASVSKKKYKTKTKKKLKKKNNVPSFINNIISNQIIIIWIILQYIEGYIPIEDFFNDNLKKSIDEYLSLKKNLRKFKKLNNYNNYTNDKDMPIYIFESIILDNVKFTYKKINLYKKIKDFLYIKPEYESDILQIYILKNIKESIQLGDDTKWCTAVISKLNEFKKYKKLDNLYTIIVKKINNTSIEKYELNKFLYNYGKYQFHKKEYELKNIYNIDVDILILYMLYPELKEYFESINVNFYNNLTLNYENYDMFLNMKDLISLYIEKFTFGKLLSKPIPDNLNFPKLKLLTLDTNDNKSIPDNLNFPNLETFKLEHNFNHPLNKSLNKLTKLQNLILSNNFNHPLNNSLNKLQNLTYLNLGVQFNQDLGDSLNKLHKLQFLDLGYKFNYPLGNSLDKLQKLEKLYLSLYNNQPIGNSLDKLTNLKEIKFSYDFNESLEHLFTKLKKIETLIFRDDNFQDEIDVLITNFTNLKIIVIADEVIYV